MESVDELCDNLAMINKSKTILSGKINDIKSAYKSDIYQIKHLNRIDDKISNLEKDSHPSQEYICCRKCGCYSICRCVIK